MKCHEMLAKFALIANEFDLLWENLVFVFFWGGGGQICNFISKLLNSSGLFFWGLHVSVITKDIISKIKYMYM